jgi:hypothetical protein
MCATAALSDGATLQLGVDHRHLVLDDAAAAFNPTERGAEKPIIRVRP